MARGTLVGEAFIRVHADNTSFAAEVAHGMHGFKNDAGEAGDEAGEEWGQRFFDSLKGELESKMAREFKQGFLTGDFSNFAHSMGDVDTAIAHINSELHTMHTEGGLLDEDFADLSRVVERFAAGVRDAEEHADLGRQAKGVESYAKFLTKAANEMGHLRDSATPTSLTLDDINSHVAKSRQGFDQWAVTLTKAAEQMDHFRDTSDRLPESTRRASLSLKDLQRQIEQGADFEKLAARMTAVARAMDFERDRADMTSISWKKMRQGLRDLDKDTGTFGNGLRRLGREHDSLANKIRHFDIGSFFGKGSRNDFLNIVGSIIGGITKVTESITEGLFKGVSAGGRLFGKLFESIFGDMISKLAASSGAFQEFVTTFQTGMSGIAKVGGPVLAALTTFAAVSGAVVLGIGLLGEALGVVTSALSLFAGGVLAAAGAVETALIGALVVAAPLLFAFAAQIGVLVTAFAAMSDEQKKLLQPMKDLFKVLQTKVQAALFKDLSNQVKGLGNLISGFLQPLLVGVATGLSTAFTTFLTIMNSASFKPFLTALTDATTRISSSLANALATALPGIIAFFKPILPLAEELAKSIEGVAQTFTAWATSAQGQNEIAAFFKTAWGEAKTLWQILLDVGGAIQTVLNVGNAVAGQDFLSWLGEKAAQLRAFLESPAGQNQLADWFREARKFGENLWTTLEKLGTMLGSLDTETNRAFANKLIIAFGRLAEIVTALVPTFEAVGKAVAFMLALVSKAFSSMFASVAQITKALSFMAIAIGGFTHNDGLIRLGEDLAKVSASTEVASGLLGGLPDQIDIDFNADDTELILAAQKAAGIVDAQDGSTVSTDFNGNTKPLDKAVSDAKKIIDGPPGAPKEVTVPFKGNLDDLVKDAAGATAIIANYNQSAVVTATFNGDTLPLVEDINKANALINTVKPTYETEFGGDTGLLMNATVNGNDIIEQVHPSWLTTFMGNTDPIEAARIQATGEILDVPIDWTTFFVGDVGQLTKDQALANDEIIKVPDTWSTTFDGETTPLMDATIVGMDIIRMVDPTWETSFIGDTSALLDSTESADRYINGVDSSYMTSFDGETYKLEQDTAAANASINNVIDFNSTMFAGNTAPLHGDANAAKAIINSVPDSHVTTLTVDMSGFIARVAYAKSLLNSLGEARVNQAGRAAGGLFGFAAGGRFMSGSILNSGARLVVAGEDGPEAIVPLRRSLARVDPSVRALSAYAQGLTPGGGITIEQGAIQVTVPNANPRNVAESVLDRLIARLN